MNKPILDVSPACFEEIKKRFEVVGFASKFIQVEDEEGQSSNDPKKSMQLLDMGGLYLRRETDERVNVWLLFDGKRLEAPKDAVHHGPIAQGTEPEDRSVS